MARQSRASPYEALLLLGDLVYEEGEANQVDAAVTKPFSAILRTDAGLIPVLGNHDSRSGQEQQILTALGRHKSWYVDRVDSVRIMVLDSNKVGDPEQTRWLRKTLAEPQPPGTWTVAAMRHPAYLAGYHGPDMAGRTWRSGHGGPEGVGSTVR